MAYFDEAAIQLISEPSFPWSAAVRSETIALILVPSLFICLAVMSDAFNLSWAIFWAWCLVFLGLAPAYQLSNSSFPWKGVFANATVAHGEALLLVGDAAVILAYLGASRHAGNEQQYTEGALGRQRAAHLMSRLLYTYAGFALLFAVLSRSSLYSARANFRDQVLAISTLPFGGTLYFIVTAGAICVPAFGIRLYRQGLAINKWALWLAALGAAIDTNPLIGSRFLSGSFYVAIGGAFLAQRQGERLLPILSIVLLVILFPTLDILRGDGTGSSGVRISSANDSLLTYNFDAFEMMLREASLQPSNRQYMPSRVTLAIAPVVRWVPLLARPYLGKAGGTAVAEATGMQYTNVSMPLWGEGDLIGGVAGTVLFLAILGWWLGTLTKRQSCGLIGRGAARAPTAALMFIILRGSLYEVLLYLVLVVVISWLVTRCLSEQADDDSL